MIIGVCPDQLRIVPGECVDVHHPPEQMGDEAPADGGAGFCCRDRALGAEYGVTVFRLAPALGGATRRQTPVHVAGPVPGAPRRPSPPPPARPLRGPLP